MYILLFIMMMTDYFLTYWGMAMGYIREGNVLMQWLMDMPLLWGIFVKVFMSAILVFPLIIFRKKAQITVRVAYILSFMAYAYVFSMHGYWIYECLL